MEKHLQEALPHVDPHVKRGYINLTGAVDRKTLAKFAETDRIITQCLRELVEALQALQIAELNAALNAQHRLGPEIVYELHIQESSPLSDSHSQYETEGTHWLAGCNNACKCGTTTSGMQLSCFVCFIADSVLVLFLLIVVVR